MIKEYKTSVLYFYKIYFLLPFILIDKYYRCFKYTIVHGRIHIITWIKLCLNYVKFIAKIKLSGKASIIISTGDGRCFLKAVQLQYI